VEGLERIYIGNIFNPLSRKFVGLCIKTCIFSAYKNRSFCNDCIR
jgi:hypothetical protein